MKFYRSELPLEPDWDDEEEEEFEPDEDEFDEVGAIHVEEARYENWLEGLKDKGGR